MLNTRPTRQPTRSAFTLIELLILLAILMILIAILAPALARARASARAAQSKNNLAQLGKAMKHYEALGKGNLKPKDWQKTLAPYLDDTDEVFRSPLRDKQPRNGGVYSYALYSGSEFFGAADANKITIVSSDFQQIDIETKTCKEGKPVVTGEPVARDRGFAHALCYAGNVRTFELEEIKLDDNQTIVTWWLPAREKNTICGEVIKLENDPR